MKLGACAGLMSIALLVLKQAYADRFRGPPRGLADRAPSPSRSAQGSF